MGYEPSFTVRTVRIVDFPGNYEPRTRFCPSRIFRHNVESFPSSSSHLDWNESGPFFSPRTTSLWLPLFWLVHVPSRVPNPGHETWNGNTNVREMCSTHPVRSVGSRDNLSWCHFLFLGRSTRGTVPTTRFHGNNWQEVELEQPDMM